MTNNLLKYILIVSLLLNFSLLGTAAYTHYRQSRHPLAPVGGPFTIPAKPGPFGHTVPGGYLFHELSLRPEQVKLFQEKASTFHRNLGRKRQEVDGLRGSLIALLRADNPDSGAIDAVIGQINAAQREMQKMVVSHMLEFKSLLDKEQQTKFLDLVQRAMGRHHEGQCPQG